MRYTKIIVSRYSQMYLTIYQRCKCTSITSHAWLRTTKYIPNVMTLVTYADSCNRFIHVHLYVRITKAAPEVTSLMSSTTLTAAAFTIFFFEMGTF